MENSRTKEFFRLFMANEAKIYTYILMFVPHRPDADDIMQETATVMWQKFADFQTGGNFTRWGKKIALHKILDYRKHCKSHHVVFSDELIDILAPHAEALMEAVDPRLDVLQTCLNKLPDKDRHLIKEHYEQGTPIKRMAEQANRSIHGLYKVMARIHTRLAECVNYGMAAWEALR